MTFRMSARSGEAFGATRRLDVLMRYLYLSCPVHHACSYAHRLLDIRDFGAGARASASRLLASTPSPTQRSIPAAPR